MQTLIQFAASLRDFFRSSLLSAEGSELPFSGLASELFRLQCEHNPPYRRWCEHRKVSPDTLRRWQDIPAVPAAAFKELELTSLAPADRIATFLSSGTTNQARSRHFHSEESLSIYRASLLPWFERHLLNDLGELVEEQLLGALDKLPMIALTPPPHQVPNSSLVHMFETVRTEFGARDSLFCGSSDATGSWKLDMDRLLFAIRKSMCANRPVMLLGTAFNFVHLVDHFASNNMRYRLAKGSRVLETGGYKGQSREVSKEQLHGLITKHLGIAPPYVVTEYGMSELSSQAYDQLAGTTDAPRTFRFPPWARALVVSPETGAEVADGGTGLLRIFDLANVWSVMAIQTEDLAVRRGDGFELIGRASRAEPRGCSLMASEPGSSGQRP